MPISQFTVLFGDKNYELHIPVSENTQYKFIDGHEVLTLAVKDRAQNAEPVMTQKEFPWMGEKELAAN